MSTSVLKLWTTVTPMLSALTLTMDLLVLVWLDTLGTELLVIVSDGVKNIPSSNCCLDVLRKKIAFMVFCKYTLYI